MGDAVFNILDFWMQNCRTFGFDMYESEMYPALRSSPRVEEEEEQVARLLAIKILVKCRPVHVSNRTTLNIRP